MLVSRDAILRVADVARRTPFSEPVIRKMVKRGQLPAHRVGRHLYFVLAELQERLGPLFRATP